MPIDQTAKCTLYAIVWGTIVMLIACSGNAQESGAQRLLGDRSPEAPYQAESKDEFNIALQPWKGDYDGMIQRKMVRILVPYSMTHYFLDGATERGIIAAAGRDLEQEINQREGLRTRLVHVVFIPVPKSQLIPWLIAGKGDISAGNLTITESRKSVVDFSEPVLRDSKEIVVTGPGATVIRGLEDLSGKDIHVQPQAVILSR